MKYSICDLPDNLLVKILLYVPIKEAVATTILSKRWRYVWTMLPALNFKDDGSKSFCSFIDNSLQLHKAPKLEVLIVELGKRRLPTVNAKAWVDIAINRGVTYLDFNLLCTKEPSRFPKNLYRCETLVCLYLANKIYVDVASPSHLPCLKHLRLIQLVYKDDEAFVNLLSSAPVLETLVLQRHRHDHLLVVTVEVRSLKEFDFCSDWYGEGEKEENTENVDRTLVIDTPSLTFLKLQYIWEDYLLIENMPCLDVAFIEAFVEVDEVFFKYFSSVKYMSLCLTETMAEYCSNVKLPFKLPSLIMLSFRGEKLVDWMDSLMIILKNSPQLKSLLVKTEKDSVPLSWKEPSYVPECLLFQLEVFGWKDYGGTEGEKQLVAYILANSMYLKIINISLKEVSTLEKIQKDLESLPRISAACQLIFHNDLQWSCI